MSWLEAQLSQGLGDDHRPRVYIRVAPVAVLLPHGQAVGASLGLLIEADGE